MKVMLDTHTLFWSIEAPTKVSTPAMAAMQDPANDRLLSSATTLGVYGWFISPPACLLAQLAKSAHHFSMPRPKVRGYFVTAPSLWSVAS